MGPASGATAQGQCSAGRHPGRWLAPLPHAKRSASRVRPLKPLLSLLLVSAAHAGAWAGPGQAGGGPAGGGPAGGGRAGGGAAGCTFWSMASSHACSSTPNSSLTLAPARAARGEQEVAALVRLLRYRCTVLCGIRHETWRTDGSSKTQILEHACRAPTFPPGHSIFSAVATPSISMHSPR